MAHYFVGIALNNVNPVYYGGWDGKLQMTLVDLNRAKEVLTNSKSKIHLFVDSEATIKNVDSKLFELSSILKRGDVMDIYYSGHGTFFKDDNSDEIDGFDEAFCLFDGFLLDDRLNYVLSNIVKGATVRLWTDCCHSGTIYKSTLQGDEPLITATPKFFNSKQLSDYNNTVATVEQPQIKCKLISFNACMDNEVAYEDSKGGVFTSNIYNALKINPKLNTASLANNLKKVKGQTPQVGYFNCTLLDRLKPVNK